MFEYKSRTWRESSQSIDACQNLLFSNAVSFDLLPGEHRQMDVSGVSFPRIGAHALKVRSSGHEILVEDQETLTIMLPTRGNTSVTFDGRNQMLGPGEACALLPSRRWTRVERPASGDFGAYLVKLQLKSNIVANFQDLEGQYPVIPTSQNALAGLTGALAYFFADVTSDAPILLHGKGAELFEMLLGEHIRKLVETDETSFRHGADQAAVRRATEYMIANSTEALTVPLVAEAAKLSTRRLQAAFRITLGTTPWKFLTRIRLEHARSRLIAGDGISVTDIALGCGFSHLGRFAITYREAFGETPSATFRRGLAESEVAP